MPASSICLPPPPLALHQFLPKALFEQLTVLTTSSSAPLTSFTSPLFFTLTTGLASSTATGSSGAGGGVADPLAGAMAVVELVDSRSEGGDGVVPAEERFLAILTEGWGGGTGWRDEWEMAVRKRFGARARARGVSARARRRASLPCELRRTQGGAVDGPSLGLQVVRVCERLCG